VEVDFRSLLLSYEALTKSRGSRQLDEDLIKKLKALGYIN